MQSFQLRMFLKQEIDGTNTATIIIRIYIFLQTI